MEILCLFHYSPRNYNVPQNTGIVYSVVNCILIRFCLVLVSIMHGRSFVSLLDKLGQNYLFQKNFQGLFLWIYSSENTINQSIFWTNDSG